MSYCVCQRQPMRREYLEVSRLEWSCLPEGNISRITDGLVGVGAVLSPAGLLAGGGALPPRHLATLLLHHGLVLGSTLATPGQTEGTRIARFRTLDRVSISHNVIVMS